MSENEAFTKCDAAKCLKTAWKKILTDNTRLFFCRKHYFWATQNTRKPLRLRKAAGRICTITDGITTYMNGGTIYSINRKLNLKER